MAQQWVIVPIPLGFRKNRPGFLRLDVYENEGLIYWKVRDWAVTLWT